MLGKKVNTITQHLDTTFIVTCLHEGRRSQTYQQFLQNRKSISRSFTCPQARIE